MRRGKAAKPEEGTPAADKTPEEPTELVHPYENSIKHVTTVTTVEDFWAAYNFLRRPNDLPTTTDYHFFRDGIKPTWEDAGNAKGGKWIVRMPKGLASRYWEEVILALIGGQFPGVPDGEICGMVISIRYSEDILGVWNRTAHEREVVERLRDAIKRVLQLPAYAPMEYKPHQNSIADKSSFRNTHVWKSISRGGTAGTGDPSVPRETRRSGSWGEREPKGVRRESERTSWR
jgi:translation initiation factor 4E